MYKGKIIPKDNQWCSTVKDNVLYYLAFSKCKMAIAVDCIDESCPSCLYKDKSLALEYFVDKGYITKEHALELTLSGIDKD